MYLSTRKNLLEALAAIDRLWEEGHPGEPLPVEITTRAWQCPGCGEFFSKDVKPESSGLCAGCDIPPKQKMIDVPPDFQ